MTDKQNHDHSHNSGIGSHNHGSSKNITTAFFINLIFTVIEIIGGLLTNSVAILSDAVHDLGDSISLLFSLIMGKLSIKKGNKVLTYGYKRYSLLGAVFSSLVLIIGSTFIIYNAVKRIFDVEEVHATGMLLMSIAGIVFNGAAALRLKNDDSLNSKVVFLHLLEDVLGWVSIFVISIIMHFVDLPILDPILSIVIAVFMLSRIVPTLMKIGRIFLQYKPDDVEIKEIKEKIEGRKEVIEIHDIHLWSLDGTNHIFSCHVVVDDKLNKKQIMELTRDLKHELEHMGINHSTLEMETEEAECDPCDDGVY